MQGLIQQFLQLFYTPFSKWLPFEIYAYLAVGAANTLLNILLFTLFYEVILPKQTFDFTLFAIESYTLSLLIAFVLTLPTGFWLSKTFAFLNAQSSQTAWQFSKYFLVVLQGLLSDYLVFKLCIVFLAMDPVGAKITSTFLVISINYLLQKYFTFK